jgi:hypothetical protein
MAADVEGMKEPRELVLASLHQTDQLTCLVHTCLTPNSSHTHKNVQSTVTAEQQGNSLPPSADISNNNDSDLSDMVDSSKTLSDLEAEPHNGEAGTPVFDQSRFFDADKSSSEVTSESEVNVTSESEVKVTSESEVKDEAGVKPKDIYIDIPSRELLAITTKLNAQLHHLMVSVRLTPLYQT